MSLESHAIDEASTYSAVDFFFFFFFFFLKEKKE
jgi:hypothetical protein